MASTLPVNVYFRLPAGWVSVPPDDIGAHASAYVAVHPQSVDGDFTANITLAGGVWPDPPPLPAIADSSVRAARESPTFEQVEVVERRELNVPAIPDYGSPELRGLTDIVKLRRRTDGDGDRLLQTQVYLPMPYPTDPHRQAVINVTLTTTPGQYEQLAGDFQFFVNTIAQRTLGVKSFGTLASVDHDKVAVAANAAADAVRDIAATADQWATVGWETLAEGDGNR